MSLCMVERRGMSDMRQATVEARKVEIYIAGSIDAIQAACAEYCKRGFCVTVTPTTYVFTGGAETGAIIGLINYARFPINQQALWDCAVELGMLILERAEQQSFTVQSHVISRLYTKRVDHIEIDCRDI